MKGNNHTCIGASHIRTGKPCQDASAYRYFEEPELHIAVVSDGHGGERYFRSDRGSSMMVDITIDAVRKFVTNLSPSVFYGSPMTQKGVVRERTGMRTQIDEALDRLFSSIVGRWRISIEDDAYRSPITEYEHSHVAPEHLLALRGDHVEKVYGCTLMCYVQTPHYWFAFHLGDGKCIMIDEEMQVFEPVLWDERCFLNQTTSACDENPLEEFRYTYQGDGHFPTAVFLASDGIDDTFGDGERLHNFYIDILKSLASRGMESTMEDLEEALPKLSQMASQDDMSVAFVYDEKKAEKASRELVCRQLKLAEKAAESIDKNITELEEKRAQLEEAYSSKLDSLDKLEHEKQMAESYLAKAQRILNNLKIRMSEVDREETAKKSVLQKLTNESERCRVELKYATNDLERARQSRNNIEARISSYREFLGEPEKNQTPQPVKTGQNHEEETDCDGTSMPLPTEQEDVRNTDRET